MEDFLGKSQWGDFEEACSNDDEYLDDPLGEEATLKEYVGMRNKWDEIEKDIKRTRNEMSFFHEETSANLKSKLVYPSREFYSERQNPETHQDIMTRILFVYVKTNPGINYTQGMNELLAIIYYTFYRYEFEDDKKFAEADAYWCF